jgi:hypothetical protein
MSKISKSAIESLTFHLQPPRGGMSNNQTSYLVISLGRGSVKSRILLGSKVVSHVHPTLTSSQGTIILKVITTLKDSSKSRRMREGDEREYGLKKLRYAMRKGVSASRLSLTIMCSIQDCNVKGRFSTHLSLVSCPTILVGLYIIAIISNGPISVSNY